jgi:putative phosphoesterase
MQDSSQRPEAITLPARIGLVADTHRRSGSPVGLPLELLRSFEICDLILHAGDFNSMAVFDELAGVAPTRGVHGNNDEVDVLRELPARRYFEVGTKRIGLLHGHQGGRTAREAAIAAVQGAVDCAIYGHSHMPDYSCENGLLLVNPGSPTQRRRAPNRSFAIMTIDERSELGVEFFTLS